MDQGEDYLGQSRTITEHVKDSFVKSGVPGVNSPLHGIENGMAGFFDWILSNMQHYSADVGNGIGRLFSGASHAISSLFLEFRNVFAAFFERTERTITSFFSSLTTAIVSIFQVFRKGIASCLHWIVSTPAWCWTALTNAVSSLWFGVQHAVTSLLHRIVRIFNALIGFVVGPYVHVVILSIVLILYASNQYVLRLIDGVRLRQEIANQEARLVAHLAALRLEEERQQRDEEERLIHDRKPEADRFRHKKQGEEERKRRETEEAHHRAEEARR